MTTASLLERIRLLVGDPTLPDSHIFLVTRKYAWSTPPALCLNRREVASRLGRGVPTLYVGVVDPSSGGGTPATLVALLHIPVFTREVVERYDVANQKRDHALAPGEYISLPVDLDPPPPPSPPPPGEVDWDAACTTHLSMLMDLSVIPLMMERGVTSVTQLTATCRPILKRKWAPYLPFRDPGTIGWLFLWLRERWTPEEMEAYLELEQLRAQCLVGDAHTVEEQSFPALEWFHLISTKWAAADDLPYVMECRADPAKPGHLLIPGGVVAQYLVPHQHGVWVRGSVKDWGDDPPPTLDTSLEERLRRPDREALAPRLDSLEAAMERSLSLTPAYADPSGAAAWSHLMAAALDRERSRPPARVFDATASLEAAATVRSQVTDLEDLFTHNHLPPCMLGAVTAGRRDRHLKHVDRYRMGAWLGGLGQQDVGEAVRFLVGVDTDLESVARGLTDPKYRTSCKGLRSSIHTPGTHTHCPYADQKECAREAGLPHGGFGYPMQFVALSLRGRKR